MQQCRIYSAGSCKFRIYAPSHAFGRRDRLNGSRRGGMFFLSRARERTKEAHYAAAFLPRHSSSKGIL